MYHVGPISLATLAVYLISLYFSATGFIEKKLHRKTWNWLLLLTFFVTAMLGVFMALQINYKWNIPFIKQLLHWHVEFGIGMSCTAIIHLTWHLKYYFGRRSESSNGEFRIENHTKTEYGRISGLMLFITGFASSAAQFMLLREAMIMGGGSEVSSGLFLWFWLMISALGALAGRSSPISDTRLIFRTFMAGLLASPLLYVLFHSVILKPGEVPGFVMMLVIIFITVAPATFATSFAFIRFTAIRQATAEKQPGTSFGLETLGSVAAGIFTSASATLFLGNFQIYIIVMIVAVMVSLIDDSRPGLRRYVVICSGALMIILVIIFRPDPKIRGILLKGIEISRSIDTPYGNISEGTYSGERAVYYDHRPVLFSDDITRNEEDIHYALLQRSDNDTLLLISGGLEKHLEEIEKYGPEDVTYIEYDPGMIMAEGDKTTSNGTYSLRIVKKDPLKYFIKSNTNFNAIIQLTPPPSTLSLNRFFTTEYFRTVKAHLAPGGVFMCTPMPYYNYSPGSYRISFSSIYKSLKMSFRHVIIIPGTSLYVVASDSLLSDEIARLAGERGIVNQYVSADYLDDNDIRSRGQQVYSFIDKSAGDNTMLRPVSSWFSNALSLEKRGTGNAIYIIIIVMAIIPMMVVRKEGIAMFSASAGLSGFGMIIICILQATLGNIYLLSSLILSLLMAGLAAGASVQAAGPKKWWILPALAVIYSLTGLTAGMIASISPGMIILLFSLVLLAAGFLTGILFRDMTNNRGIKVTSAVYSSDLAGAATGYMTVSVILVPLAGINVTSYILSAVILLTWALASLIIKH